MEIILASGSPRRIEMFQTCGFTTRVCPSNVEETIPLPLSHGETVMYLALKKALSVKETLSSRQIIVGADTVVISKEGKLLGKPENEEEAWNSLQSMRNTYHYVMTGVSIVTEKASLCFYETTRVFFSHYTDEELFAYVQTKEPYDKAGGYAIQETFGKYVSHIEGDKNNVIGFPMTRFQQELDSFLSLDR